MTQLIFGEPVEGQHLTARRAAYVVIRKAGSVVTVKNREKHFLPGGGCETGETARETVLRETVEELDCKVIIDGHIGEAVQYFYSTDDQLYYKMTATFFVGSFDSSAPGGSDAGGIFWLPESNLGDSLFHECHHWAIQEATNVSKQTR
ncbi:MAG: NUDIX domain-containing protein [Acidobacteriota bacterium]